MTITSSSSLSDKDIEKMFSDTKEFTKTDKAYCADTKKAMNKLKDQIDATEKEVSKLIIKLCKLAQKGQAADSSVDAKKIHEKISETQQALLGLSRRYIACLSNNFHVNQAAT
ncbi:hypothetical protein BT96DRAFT_1006995 [Gymnopus androsaceus JB14]|uniref:Uncharacterized protein n=1 Tax=Gymnopus androsaceus JB14 TaxID=1447944 RepID=A0A6A4GJ22_9AGAR|nr:hypothetical protein BT96DRAFT_1006995 [Gymnopus androsaceus JB14]